MKSWFKKIGQKLYGKKPERQLLQSENKNTPLKEKKPVVAKIQETPKLAEEKLVDPKIQDTPKPAEEKLVDPKIQDTPKPTEEKPVVAKIQETPKPAAEKPVAAKVEKKYKTSWFSKLGENFKRTSSGIKKAIFSKKINNDDLDYLEEAFLMSDLGVTFTDQLINELKKKKN